MVSKVFEPLKFDCIADCMSINVRHTAGFGNGYLFGGDCGCLCGVPCSCERLFVARRHDVAFLTLILRRHRDVLMASGWRRCVIVVAAGIFRVGGAVAEEFGRSGVILRSLSLANIFFFLRVRFCILLHVFIFYLSSC